MENSGDKRPNITCESKLDTIEQRIVWKIDKYSIRSKQTGTCWSSGLFEFTGLNDGTTKWELRYYPLGERNADYSTFRLFNMGSSSLETYYEVFVRGLNDAKQYVSAPTGALNISSGCSLSIPNFIKIDSNSNVLDCLVNNSLTLVCDITVLGADTNALETTSPDPASNYDEVKNIEQMSHDILNAFNNSNNPFNPIQDSSDVTINCEGKEFRCHQFILSSRSPVFEAMLKTNMMEQETGSIEIEDFSKDVVEKMLVYIYGGVVPNIDKDAKELLNIAEKYQLQQLKISLGEKLVSTLTNDNCIEYLAIGDLLHVKKLKEAALKFLQENLNSIMKNKNWKEGLTNLPAILGWEVMEEVVKK